MLYFVRVVLVLSLHSHRMVTRTEVGTREWGIAVTGLTVLSVGGIRKSEVVETSSRWTRKVAEHFVRGGHPSRNKTTGALWAQLKRFQRGRISVAL